MTEVHHTFSRYNRQYRTNSAFNGVRKLESKPAEEIVTLYLFGRRKENQVLLISMLPLRKDSFASWLVLFCVFCSQLMLGGICLNGGLFYIIFRETFGSSAVATSWLCSLPITLWFFACMYSCQV